MFRESPEEEEPGTGWGSQGGLPRGGSTQLEAPRVCDSQVQEGAGGILGRGQLCAEHRGSL